MNDEMNPASDPVQDVPVIAPPTEAPVIAPPPTEPAAPPMEVISVDELLERIAQSNSEPEESGEPVEEDPAEAQADVPVVEPDPVLTILEQVGGKLIDMIGNLDRIEEYTESMDKNLEIIGQTMNHPALTTPFADYTVTEALLLLLLLFVFIAACARMLKGGLSWLRS